MLGNRRRDDLLPRDLLTSGWRLGGPVTAKNQRLDTKERECESTKDPAWNPDPVRHDFPPMAGGTQYRRLRDHQKTTLLCTAGYSPSDAQSTWTVLGRCAIHHVRWLKQPHRKDIGCHYIRETVFCNA